MALACAHFCSGHPTTEPQHGAAQGSPSTVHTRAPLGQHSRWFQPSSQGDTGTEHTGTLQTCSTLAPGGFLGYPRPIALWELLAHVCFVSTCPPRPCSPCAKCPGMLWPMPASVSATPPRAPCECSSLSLLAHTPAFIPAVYTESPSTPQKGAPSASVTTPGRPHL